MFNKVESVKSIQVEVMYIRDFAIIGMFVFILARGLAVLTFGDSTDDFSPETHFAGNSSVDLKRQGGHDSLAMGRHALGG
jgi:hypothetical protein